MIGKLNRVPIREVWKHEAYDLTRWLSENPEVLSETINRAITNVESEQSVGSFSADLTGEDEAGNLIVIENQFGKSDHDHLGKLVTYASGLDAKLAVWIVEEARPEHTKAINWLNEAGTTGFYLIKLEAVQINDSEPAPLLTLITSPSEEVAEAGRTKKEWAERHVLRSEFWVGLLERSNAKTKLFANISPGPDTSLWAGSGKSGVVFTYRLLKTTASVDISFATPDVHINSELFTNLRSHQKAIDQSFGTGLIWDEMEGRQACRVRYELSHGGYRSPRDEWPEIQEEMADAMSRLEEAVKPYLLK